MLNLNADDLRALASFLDTVTEATKSTGVHLAPYGMESVEVSGVAIGYTWRESESRYVLEERG